MVVLWDPATIESSEAPAWCAVLGLAILTAGTALRPAPAATRKDSPTPSALARFSPAEHPVRLSGLLLLGGVVALTGWSLLVERGLQTDAGDYDPHPSLLLEAVQGLPQLINLLVVGSLSLMLVATGRRFLWVPLALVGAALPGAVVPIHGAQANWSDIPQGSHYFLQFQFGGSQFGSGALFSVAAFGLAALPLLLAPRPQRQDRWSVDRTLLLGFVVAAGVYWDAARSLSPWTPGASGGLQLLPALTLLAFTVLVVAGPLRWRWVLPVLLLAVVALPECAAWLQVQYIGFGGYPGQAGNFWSASLFAWGVVVPICLGAATPWIATRAARVRQRLAVGRAAVQVSEA